MNKKIAFYDKIIDTLVDKVIQCNHTVLCDGGTLWNLIDNKSDYIYSKEFGEEIFKEYSYEDVLSNICNDIEEIEYDEDIDKEAICGDYELDFSNSTLKRIVLDKLILVKGVAL